MYYNIPIFSQKRNFSKSILFLKIAKSQIVDSSETSVFFNVSHKTKVVRHQKVVLSATLYYGQTKPVQGKSFFKFQPQSKTKIILKPGNNCNSNNIFGAPYFYEHSLGAKIILNHGNNSNLSYIFGAPHFYEQCSDAKEFMVNNFIITWCLVKTIISIEKEEEGL